MEGKEGALEAAPEAAKQALGGGCQSGWGRTNAILALAVRETVTGHRLGSLEGGAGYPPLPMRPWGGGEGGGCLWTSDIPSLCSGVPADDGIRQCHGA